MKSAVKRLAVLLVLALAATACGGGTESDGESTVADTDGDTAETTDESAAEEGGSEEEAVDEPAPTGPTVGGNLVIRLTADPETWDPQIQTGGRIFQVLSFVGASLVAKDPVTGDYIPYLAESWSSAEDGTFWEFNLRDDIVFHNGDPMTAEDYVFTINRALDPDVASPATAAIFRGVTDAEAIDDYTLRINLGLPNYPLLDNLTGGIFTMPLSQRQFEEEGDAFGSNGVVSVGPYRFREWTPGDRVILERNEDYVWGPEWSHGGPPYIETLEFPVIPEYSTALAGLETGEIDYLGLQPNDVERMQESTDVTLTSSLTQGIDPVLLMNVSAPPFDELLVRQALNMGVDRDLIIEVVALGQGVPQNGPISSSVHGYWPGVEDIGYAYDVDAAKAALEEAGYSLNGDGIYERDGEALALSIVVVGAKPSHVRLAEVLQQMYGEIGVGLEIEQLEEGVMTAQLGAGDYTIAIDDWRWADSSLIFGLFHTFMLGALNQSKVSDQELDGILAGMMFATNAEDNQAAADAAQQYVVEQAFVVPIYTPMEFAAMNNRVQGAISSPILGLVFLQDAYIQE